MTELLDLVISLLIGIITTFSGFSLKNWINVKTKISQIRILIDSLDDALHDDKVSSEEFTEIFSNFKETIKK